MTRTQAQIKAQKKYDRKRGDRPILSVRMSREEKDFCLSVLDQFDGSKKEGIIQALKLLKDSI